MDEDVIVRRDQHVVRIRLNRPQKKNALTMSCYTVMAETIEQAESDLSVRAVVFLGSGGNFTAGHDLSSPPAPGVGNEPSPPLRLIRSLVKSSVPIIAAVEGMAVGIGATMLLHLDSVIADAHTTLLFPFVNLAVVPEAGATLLLPQILGYTRAAELLMKGKPFSGQAAYDLGLVSTLAEPGQVEDQALEMAADFASKPPGAMRKTKRLLKGDIQALLDRIGLEEQQLLECFSSPEAREAMAAFREKRPPDFSAQT